MFVEQVHLSDKAAFAGLKATFDSADYHKQRSTYRQLAAKSILRVPHYAGFPCADFDVSSVSSIPHETEYPSRTEVVSAIARRTVLHAKPC